MAAMTLNDMPTLSDLYKEGKLQPSNTSGSKEPSATINAKVSLLRMDITSLRVTAIVNAANSSLRGGGGVDGAIHRAAGTELLAACRPLGGCPTGSAKITSGFRLPAKYVIHAVGPIYDPSDRETSASLLKGCYWKSLELAAEAAKKEEGSEASVAFSCISTGVYGYPTPDACHIAATTVWEWLYHRKDGTSAEEGKISRIIFCCFEEKDVHAYTKILPQYFPPTKKELASPQDAPEAPAEGQKSEALELDSEDWEKVERPAATDIVQPDDTEVKETVKDGISEGTQENSGGVDNNAQNQLMKDW